MSGETIPPALSADEWRERQFRTEDAEIRVQVEDAPAATHLRAWPTDYDEPARVFADRLPAVIALANAARTDDDPGKLTREDVAFLERFAASFRSMMDTHAFEFEALAAKLAALLPPEGT